MSLQFIMGNPGSGKSHILYENVIQESMKNPGKKYIILVPEQFTMQTQKELVYRHPRHGIMNIDILSFERLAFRVLEETGEDRRKILDEEGKSLILRKIAGELEASLSVLKGNLKKPGYISEVKSVISELTQYSIDADGMEELLESAKGQPYLSYKLRDIQMIYQRFEEYLAEKYITKEEILERLCHVIGKSRMLKGSEVAIDGFTGFTPIQNKVLEAMLCVCDKVQITVTMDGREDPYHYESPYQLFALSKHTISTLTKVARKNQVEIEDAICLFQKPVYRFKDQKALAHLEESLFRQRYQKYEPRQNQIRIYCAANPKKEVICAAQRIRTLIRKKGYRYRDIAVIASDMKVYGSEIEKIFEAYHIPVFMDYKRSVLLNSFVEYVRSLIAMIDQNYSMESVFRFLRTGFSDFTEEEIDRLENHVIALGIRGIKKWQEKWIRRKQDETEEELEEMERLRQRFVDQISVLHDVLKKRKKTVTEITTALYEFFVREEVQKKVKAQEQLFHEAGELALEKEYAQIYKVMLELFDKFVELMGDECISLKEYGQLLDAGMEEARIGVIPPALDQVMAGDIERTRLKDIKALILIGANDVLLPGKSASGGLLSERDREQFFEDGITLAPGIKEQLYIQKFYLYLHMTKPTEELDLFYSKVSQEGKTIRPAYLIHEVKKLYPHMPIFDMEQYGLKEMELIPETGIDYLTEGFRKKDLMEDAFWQELYRWYMKNPEWKEEILRLVQAGLYRKPEDQLTKETAEKIFGEKEPSISRMEKYASCACAHFLTYGLRMKEREEYEFAAVDFGNLFHKALEKYAKKIRENEEDWTSISEEKQNQYIDECIEESIVDYSNTVLYSSYRNHYMIARLTRIMRRTIWALTHQLKQGEFRPEAFEAQFKSGKIDRIDVSEQSDKVYVKIMDYKTGNTEFDLTSFYYGLQMQLVTYMNEALEMERKKFREKEIVPAGMFYYHMKDPLVDKIADPDLLEKAILKELRLDGIINGTEEIIHALDQNFTGTSTVIPVSRTAKNELRSNKVFEPEEFQTILDYAKEKKKQIWEDMKQGKTEAFPYEMGQRTGCDYCPYHHICGFDQKIKGYEYHKLPKLEKQAIFMQMQKEMGGESDGNEVDSGTGTSY